MKPNCVFASIGFFFFFFFVVLVCKDQRENENVNVFFVFEQSAKRFKVERADAKK
jgi:hypothetical protein